MSGGRFDYDQYKIGYIAEAIEKEIEMSGKPKTRQELKDEPWHDAEWYKKYPEDLNHYKYSDEVIAKFKDAINILKIAEVYAHRIDWLLSGDDGEESFLKRFDNDLEKLNKQ
jgi:hypothetical protein